METKVCNKCDETKPLTEYHKNGWKPDGTRRYNGSCISCRKEGRKLHYWADPQKHNESSRAWRAANKESVSKYNREYNQANRDALLTYHSEYNKSHSLQRRQAAEKRRALKLEAFVEDVDIQVLIERDGTACYLCEAELMFDVDRAVHLEHKTPISRGGEHSYANTALACAPCNLSKRDKTEAEYREWLQALVA